MPWTKVLTGSPRSCGWACGSAGSWRACRRSCTGRRRRASRPTPARPPRCPLPWCPWMPPPPGSPGWCWRWRARLRTRAAGRTNWWSNSAVARDERKEVGHLCVLCVCCRGNLTVPRLAESNMGLGVLGVFLGLLLEVSSHGPQNGPRTTWKHHGNRHTNKQTNNNLLC